MKFNRRILKESNTEAMQGPKIGPDAGIAASIIEAINGEWDTINLYNSLAMNAREYGFEDIAKVLDEINTEENKHVGQLQEILKMISPNTSAIEDGKQEVADIIDDDTSWYDEENIV